MELVINLDVLFLNDLVMTVILLWAAARLARLKVKIWRLGVGGTVGAIYTLLLLWPGSRSLPDGLYIIFHILLNVGTALTIVRLAYGKMPMRKFVKILGYFYLVTFIAGGAALSLYFIAGSAPSLWIFDWIGLGDSYAWLYLIAVMMAVGVGRYGWNLIREKLWKEEYQFTLQIWVDGRSVEMRGLVDTGNMLHDPVTNLPVIVVESSALMDLFPPEVQEILADNAVDVVDQLDRLVDKAGLRFRLIPYESIGNEGSLMIGCKPDRVEVVGRTTREVRKVVLGLHAGRLDLEGDYQALLHRKLLEAV